MEKDEVNSSPLE